MWTLYVLNCVLFVIHVGAQVVASHDICPDSTTSNRKYSYLNTIPLSIINKSSLVFSVRACDHARVTFTKNKKTIWCSYRIVLGYTRPSDGEVITKITACLCTEKHCLSNISRTPWILDCNEFRTFWISISNVTIEVGTGNKLYSNQIESLSLFDEISPDYVGINVVSENSSRWRFEKDFYPYINISTDLYCETNAMTEPTASAEVTTGFPYVPTNTGDVTTSFAEEEICKCPCSNSTHKWNYLQILNLTKDELRRELSAYLYDLQQSIAINIKETSKNKAKRASAVDKRFSSASLGWFGAFIVACIPIAFICIDLLKVFKNI